MKNATGKIVSRGIVGMAMLSLGGILGGCVVGSEEGEFGLEAVGEAEQAVLNATGSGIQFNGSNFAYAQLAAGGASETAYTAELWFKTSTGNGGLFELRDSVYTSSDRSIYLSGGNVCARVADGGAGETICSSGTNYADGAWHHVAHTLGATGKNRIYVDSALKASGNRTSSTFTTDTHMFVGHTVFNQYALNGQVDEVRIWSVERTEANVRGAMYREHPAPTTSLTGYWRFNGDGTDSSGYGQTASYTGTLVASTAPIYNSAFNGQSWATMYVSTAPNLNFSGSFSLEAWIRPTGYAGGSCVMCSSGRYEIQIGNNGALSWTHSTTGGEAKGLISAGVAAPLNTWTHVAMVYDMAASKSRFYKNGVLAKEIVVTGAGIDADTDHNEFRVGLAATSVQTFAFVGQIDDVRAWSLARAQADISNTMYTQIGGATSGLQGMWYMNSGSGTMAPDATLNRYNGTLLSPATFTSSYLSPSTQNQN